MKAFIASSAGPVLEERPTPEPGPEDVLVRVRAAALNRVDLSMARGAPHGAAGGMGNPLGVEFAGEVVKIGAAVKSVQPGDRVMCSGSGGFAEYALADSGRAQKIPDANLSFEQAAGMPVALQTMHDAIVTNGALKPGQTVLMQGASSAVGLMGMMIAKAFGASLVIGSSTDPKRRARLPEFGADLAIDSKDPDWVKQVTDATNGAGADLIVDMISGPTANQNLRAAKILGRIVNVGRLGGQRGEFDFDLHAMRRITYVGVTFRTRSKAEVREITRRMRADLEPLLAAGKLTLPVDKVFPFAQLPDALAHMAANRHLGKIVVAL